LGKDPGDSWTPEQLLSELYARYDTERARPFDALYSEGQAAFLKGDFRTMEEKYRAILAGQPYFEKRDQMAEGFFEFGLRIEKQLPPKAQDLFAIALRITEPDHPFHKKAEARLDEVKAEMLSQQGIYSKQLFQSVLSSDPSIPKASKIMNDAATLSAFNRDKALKAMVVSMLMFGALSLVYQRFRRKA
jgi:hypothetical protein